MLIVARAMNSLSSAVPDDSFIDDATCWASRAVFLTKSPWHCLAAKALQMVHVGNALLKLCMNGSDLVLQHLLRRHLNAHNCH